MVKPIVRDVLFLGQNSEEATEKDTQVITDLKDTLRANHDRCVGMAANMIGYRKRIIIVSMGFMDMIMINPVILQKSGAYEKIRVQYLNEAFQKQTQEYEGYIAQIIQHECDHLEGIII